MDAASSPLLPGTFNSRDLGGLTTVGGAVLRPGLIIRSDAPVAIGNFGHAALRRLGVRSAVDLREPVEREHDPPDLAGTGIDVVSVPILGSGFDAMRHASLQEIYRGIITTRGVAVAAAIGALAELPAGAAIVFCSAGKDRVGAPAELILDVLQWVSGEYGGARDYLLGHGLAEAQLGLLEHRLLEPLSDAATSGSATE